MLRISEKSWLIKSKKIVVQFESKYNLNLNNFAKDCFISKNRTVIINYKNWNNFRAVLDPNCLCCTGVRITFSLCINKVKNHSAMFWTVRITVKVPNGFYKSES